MFTNKLFNYDFVCIMWNSLSEILYHATPHTEHTPLQLGPACVNLRWY